MSFLVSARKYRPGQFDEVIGQAHVTDTLKMALMQNKLAHAFLFTGPRGVGKTTCARILAKVINCENSTDAKACDTCRSCSSFAENASFNIIELDAASNNSVEHMRTLIDQVRFQPQYGKYKVFIIDEVHMLSSAAFNAFLKTLEEPPPYAIFILATTEKHKIIPTILSRCQIFDFKRITISGIIQQLQEIAEKEQIDIQHDALFLIAEKADGALRDALSVFDRIVGSADGPIDHKLVIEKLNILDHDYYFRISDALACTDSMMCLTLFNEIFMNGFEGDHFMNGLAEHFRRLLLTKDNEGLKLLEISDSLKRRYKNQSDVFLSSELLSFLDIANQCDVEYPKAKNKRLHIEIALLKMAHIGKLKSIPIPVENSGEKKTLPGKLTSKKNKAEKILTAEESESESKSPEITSGKENKQIVRQNSPALHTVDKLIEEVNSSEKEQSANAEMLDHEKLRVIWEDYTSGHNSPSIKNALKKTILQCDEKEIQVIVPTSVCKEMILQETELMETIRMAFHAPDLNLNVEVDRSQFPDTELLKPNKFLTVKEKYDLLNEKNPLLKELIRKLDLKLDQDM